jgi:ribokinase
LNQGANAKVTVDYISGYLELLRAMDIVVLQNEIPLETTRFICKELCDSEVKVLFDPAPFEGVDPVEFLGVDYFTPNETECKALTGYDTSCSESIYQSLKYLQDIGIKTPIITMGKNGVAYIEKGVVERVKAYRVDAMDSTAAGDTFSGALAAELADGKTVKEAIKFANAAAAITTTRIGAQKSIPTRQEVLDWLIEKSDLR